MSDIGQKLESLQPSQPATREASRGWHIVTSEYPPRSGGVSDYAYLLAKVLASVGDRVHVWCPVWAGTSPATPGVEVHPILGRFSPGDMRRTGRELNRFDHPRRIFLQWVPHGFGRKGINLPFCLWIWHRCVFRGDLLELMVHEPFIGFKKTSWRQSAAAVVQRLMMAILLNAASRVCVSTPSWEKYLRRLETQNRGRSYLWLPLPSNVPALEEPSEVRRIRDQYARGRLLIGHFGTFGTAITPLLHATIPPILRAVGDANLILIGPGGEAFQKELLNSCPDLADRIQALGRIDARDPLLSLHLSACDLMVQPYPDGVTSRRTTVMAPLSHGRPVVTTSGALTEAFWETSRAVEITPVADTETFVQKAIGLLQDPWMRMKLGQAALDFYRNEFAIERVVDRLCDAR